MNNFKIDSLQVLMQFKMNRFNTDSRYNSEAIPNESIFELILICLWTTNEQNIFSSIKMITHSVRIDSRSCRETRCVGMTSHTIEVSDHEINITKLVISVSCFRSGKNSSHYSKLDSVLIVGSTSERYSPYRARIFKA